MCWPLTSLVGSSHMIERYQVDGNCQERTGDKIGKQLLLVSTQLSEIVYPAFLL